MMAYQYRSMKIGGHINILFLDCQNSYKLRGFTLEDTYIFEFKQWLNS